MKNIDQVCKNIEIFFKYASLEDSQSMYDEFIKLLKASSPITPKQLILSMENFAKPDFRDKVTDYFFKYSENMITQIINSDIHSLIVKLELDNESKAIQAKEDVVVFLIHLLTTAYSHYTPSWQFYNKVVYYLPTVYKGVNYHNYNKCLDILYSLHTKQELLSSFDVYEQYNETYYDYYCSSDNKQDLLCNIAIDTDN